jgi:hypothetical protein
MNTINWDPSSFEDRLLDRYLKDNVGKLFLEVPVGGTNNPLNARRIDGVLIPDNTLTVYPPNKYTTEDLQKEINGSSVHLVEAKRTLNRNVIGQVQAGSSLFLRDFNPSNLHPVALCASGEPDLEWVCNQEDIEVAIYPIQSYTSDDKKMDSPTTNRNDIRKDPDQNRRSAFLAGWTDAVNGQLYKSARKRKTHANMGNLFGWIYGDQDYDFRIDTWDRYVDQLNNSEHPD